MYLSRKFEVPGKIRCETTRKVYPENRADFNNHLAFQALEDGEQRGAIGKGGGRMAGVDVDLAQWPSQEAIH